MNVLPLILRFIPGISPQWRELITESSRALGQYKNTRQDLLRAIADRNIRLEDIRQGMSYLQSGPVAGILNSIRPGSAQQLHNLFRPSSMKKQHHSQVGTQQRRTAQPTSARETLSPRLINKHTKENLYGIV